jgi:hypothetical protein
MRALSSAVLAVAIALIAAVPTFAHPSSRSAPSRREARRVARDAWHAVSGWPSRVTRVGPLRGEDRRRVRGRVYVDCGIERCVMPARAVVRYLPQDGASVAVVVRLLSGRFRRCRPADRCDQFLD